jgi:hypothetical protein
MKLVILEEDIVPNFKMITTLPVALRIVEYCKGKIVVYIKYLGHDLVLDDEVFEVGDIKTFTAV